MIGGPARTPSTAELLDAVERTGAAEVIILPNDPAIVTSVILLLAVIGLTGAWSPAERAVKVNPIAVLNDE